jgi:hypothetical protein
MATRLDVGNLREGTRPDDLRARFEACGEVVEVRIVHGGHAFVTMASHEEARSALETMNGAVFEERALQVTRAREQPKEAPRPRSVEPHRLRVTKTYLERCNVAYEIDHHGMPLSIRMYPTDDGGGEPHWRVDVSSSRAGDGVISAAAPTRAAALEAVGGAWRTAAAGQKLPMLDWNAIVQLMNDVRAL